MGDYTYNDSSKISLKIVLLHNGKDLSSVALDHAVHRKEAYESSALMQMM
jgi:hypothetical protein